LYCFCEAFEIGGDLLEHAAEGAGWVSPVPELDLNRRPSGRRARPLPLSAMAAATVKARCENASKSLPGLTGDTGRFFYCPSKLPHRVIFVKHFVTWRARVTPAHGNGNICSPTAAASRPARPVAAGDGSRTLSGMAFGGVVRVAGGRNRRRDRPRAAPGGSISGERTSMKSPGLTGLAFMKYWCVSRV